VRVSVMCDMLRVWCVRDRIPGFPHRVHGDTDPVESEVGAWEDVAMSGDDIRRRRVTAKGLLPATRYRFRYRCRDAVHPESWMPWSLSSLSDWYLTKGACWTAMVL
jgi:hypothetical protein